MPLKKLLAQVMATGDVVIVEHGIATYKREGDEVWIGAVWVHPCHRREGVGLRLIQRIAQQARQEGAQKLCAKTMLNRPDVTAMFITAGFTKVSVNSEHIWWQDHLAGWRDGVG